MDQRINRRYGLFVFVVFLFGAISHEIFELLVQGLQLFQRHCVPLASGFVNDSALDYIFAVGPGSHLVMNERPAGQIRGVVANVPNKPVNGFILGVRPFGLDCYVDRFPGLFPVRFDLNNVMFDSVRFHIGF